MIRVGILSRRKWHALPAGVLIGKRHLLCSEITGRKYPRRALPQRKALALDYSFVGGDDRTPAIWRADWWCAEGGFLANAQDPLDQEPWT